MRKILIGILLIALLAIFGAMVASGLEVANFPIGYSVKTIINKNENVDKQIAQVETRITQDYKTAENNLEGSLQRLQTQKKNYQNKIAYATEEELKAATQVEQYKLDYLWTNIGLYATNNNLVMKADLTNGTSRSAKSI